MKQRVRHLRVTERIIVGQRPPFLELDLRRFVKQCIENMQLAARHKMRQCKMDYLFERREILDRTGKHNTVEQLIFKNTRPDVPMYEPEIGIVAEYPGSLLQLGKIYIKTRHLSPGDLRQLMGKPAIAAGDLQYL